MILALKIKYIFASLVNYLGIINFSLERYKKHDYLILMYHRVIPTQKASKGVEAGMYVDPKTFEKHIKFLKKHFEIVTLREISERTMSICANLGNKPMCVLTFDDGWNDFYQYVYPILKKYQISATVFLPIKYIGSRDWFWTDRFLSLIHHKTKIEKTKKYFEIFHDDLVNRIESFELTNENEITKIIDLMKKLPNDQIEEILSDLSKRWNQDPIISDRAFLSWEEVLEMARSGLVYFGSHTVSHNILGNLTEEEIWDELVVSKEFLISKNVVSPDFVPFCYPNGNWNAKIVKLVKQAGYSVALTTDKGWNRVGSDLFSLRRVGVHQDVTSTEAMFGCRIAGII